MGQDLDSAVKATSEINYCIRCGAQLVIKQRFGKVRPVCPRCEWTYFADPKVAVAALIRNGDKILMVRRAVNPQKGLWTLPAGFIDAGEDPRQGLVRECSEEIGVEIRTGELVDVLFGGEYRGGADILIVYTAEIISGGIQPNDDVDLANFFPVDALPPLAFNTTLRIIDKIKI